MHHLEYLLPHNPPRRNQSPIDQSRPLLYVSPMANEVIGFKDWDVICEALGSGRQDIIFRKGGIHEGREGFSFKHGEFFLFPTLFHAQADFVTEGKKPAKPEWQVGDEVVIQYFCKAVEAKTFTEWSDVMALRDRHVWTDETIRDRFDWEGKGMATGSIHCAFLEVYELAEPWVLTYEKKFGGCRSWLNLPEPPSGWDKGLKKVK